ncbi:MAG: SIS domain-containing protein [Candidatus Latescibacteria bacterium]|nr:SIS domain-containing protein [Candidatus Latescibacterota bacterium]
MISKIRESYLESQFIINEFCTMPENFEKSFEISQLLVETFNNNGKIMIAGNGGSACDAMHFSEEFTGRFRKDRKPLPVISFTDPAHITAVSNDFGFEEVFTKSIEAFGKKGDVFIGLSTSGNSPNILKAVEKCGNIGITTIGLLGRDGGKMKHQCDYELIIPGKSADKVQEMHMIILHIIIEGVERIMFPENYR